MRAPAAILGVLLAVSVAACSQPSGNTPAPSAPATVAPPLAPAASRTVEPAWSVAATIVSVVWSAEGERLLAYTLDGGKLALTAWSAVDGAQQWTQQASWVPQTKELPQPIVVKASDGRSVVAVLENTGASSTLVSLDIATGQRVATSQPLVLAGTPWACRDYRASTA